MTTQDALATEHAPACAPRTRALRGVLQDAAALVVVALVLTVVLGMAQDVPWRRLHVLLAAMLIITGSFGVIMNVLYRWAWPALARVATGFFGRAVVHVLLVGGGSVAGTELSLLLCRLAFGAGFGTSRSGLLGIGIAISAVMVGVSLSVEQLQQRAREAELRARLQALQARTNPHFLFNSLNTVAGLVAEDPDRAERVLERLSGLYRHVLERSQAERIRLDEEMAAVRDYLEIEAIRLGSRLRFAVDCEPATLSALVTPMMLQPLVENAVLHGVASRREGGSVRVSARRDGDMLALAVEDDGPGPGGSARKGTGQSLQDLRDRLALAHGPRASVEDGAGPAGGFRVVVRIPWPGGASQERAP